MPATLDNLMESASQALADLDYARCESLCLDALSQARDAADWVMYQRVMLPLQEARRQKRQAALDGPVQLGTPQREDDTAAWLADHEQGCIVLTCPFTASDAKALNEKVHAQKRPIEVLFADNAADATTWRITSYAGPNVSVDLPAPKPQWVGKPLTACTIAPPTPAHWFMQASEALGNAALADIDTKPGSLNDLVALEQALACVDDHEILHQRLAAAAKSLHEAKR